MTNEEAIKRIQQDLDVNKKYLSKEYKEALNMAIEALSANTVSREFYEEAIKANHGLAQELCELKASADRPTDDDIKDRQIKQLAHYVVLLEKQVNSTERVGEWIFKDNNGGFAGEYHCGNCGKRAEVDLYGEWILSNYCPNCGAKMKGGTE